MPLNQLALAGVCRGSTPARRMSALGGGFNRPIGRVSAFLLRDTWPPSTEILPASTPGQYMPASARLHVEADPIHPGREAFRVDLEAFGSIAGTHPPQR